MKGGAIPFVDDDSDDAGLMYDDIGGIAPAPFEKAPKEPQEPTNGALPDLTPSPQKKKKSGKTDGWRTAKTSDRHELYELSVQNVEGEIDFVEKQHGALQHVEHLDAA